jgi:transcriptional regulator with XRE-family HTH domain
VNTGQLPIGLRIRHAREQARRTQAAVAGLCGITVDYLSQIERGLRIPSLEVLFALARELDVPPARLLSDAPQPSRPPERGAAAVAQALMGYPPRPADQVPVPPAQLRDRVEAAWQMWQTATDRFTEAARVLPALVLDVEHAVRAQRAGTDAAARREALRCAADLYGLLRSYCRRTGRIDLSLMVADRAVRAAEDADDPIRIAAARWNIGHVLLGDGRAAEAQDVALRALDELRAAPAGREREAMAGALELVAVLGAARRKQWWPARDRLRDRAAPHAERAGEGNVARTVFGPTNIELHRLSIEMEAGEAGEALRIADGIDTSALPSRERRFTFGLEVARCYDQRREDAAVLVHLLELEQLAPEDLAHSPEARAVVLGLLHRVRPTYRRQVADLAQRIGAA